MNGWNITWIAEGYAASNETIEVAYDIEEAIANFRNKMKQQFPNTKIFILAIRNIQ